MTTLERLIETGSYKSKDDLDSLIKSLQERIKSIRIELRNTTMSIEQMMLKIDDLNKASIYLEEFKQLRDEL